MEITTRIATCIFDEGTISLLKILKAMGVHTEHIYMRRRRRTPHQKGRPLCAQQSTRMARQHRRQEQIEVLEAAAAAEVEKINSLFKCNNFMQSFKRAFFSKSHFQSR